MYIYIYIYVCEYIYIHTHKYIYTYIYIHEMTYRGTSLTRKRTPLVPYTRPMPRAL